MFGDIDDMQITQASCGERSCDLRVSGTQANRDVAGRRIERQLRTGSSLSLSTASCTDGAGGGAAAGGGPNPPKSMALPSPPSWMAHARARTGKRRDNRPGQPAASPRLAAVRRSLFSATNRTINRNETRRSHAQKTRAILRTTASTGGDDVSSELRRERDVEVIRSLDKSIVCLLILVIRCLPCLAVLFFERVCGSFQYLAGASGVADLQRMTATR